ncbi:hypothetical protein MPSEU_000023800 [Mayamaea pseudoterrestris]|nr:hypothetical protein MPSEU_000023800 [Mayamaea pseudoterrestris]
MMASTMTQLMSPLLFSQIIGVSSFASVSIRLDRTFAVNAVASTKNIAQHLQLYEQIDGCIRENRDPRKLISQLEAMESIKKPNRQEEFRGEWHVWYTDCPPPSNGVLGPFQGTSSQFIGRDGGYQNFLKVSPNDWLTATLDGIWEDWDGFVIRDKGDKLDESSSSPSDKNRDWGANHWKVTFKQLQIKLFGFPLFTKQFEANTSRVWRTTYLQSDVRIVRAGKTGRLEDEVVFYTRRNPAPSPLYDYQKK